MKSLVIAAVLAFVGFASLAGTASAEHFGGYGGNGGYGGYGGYGGGRAACGPNYGYSQFGQWSQGPLRPQLNLSRSSGWNHGHHDHHGHDHGHVQRRGNNSGFYFGNRDFSLGIRF